LDLYSGIGIEGRASQMRDSLISLPFDGENIEIDFISGKIVKADKFLISVAVNPDYSLLFQ
jgi:hypothetical protein